MRVMQVIGSRMPGGAETFYVRMLAALGEKCDVLPVVRQDSWLAAQLKEDGIAFEAAPFGGFFDLKTRGLLRGYMESFQPDIIQYWMNRAARFAPEARGAVSVARLGGYYNLKYYRKMDYLVANTRDIAGYIRECGWPEDRVLYIPNFAEAPAPDFKSERASVRALHGLPEDAFVLLAAGRLHENKGFDLLLTALGRLPGNVYLLLAGEGPLEEALRSAAARAGVTSRVRFLGWIRRLSPLCAAADLWVVPSRYEPLGNVVLDAWMHGLPVVAARAKGPASLIEDGETGVLVEVEDAACLAGAIEALMADARACRDMARRGEARALAEFSADKVIARYLDFYRDAQKRRAKSCAA